MALYRVQIRAHMVSKRDSAEGRRTIVAAATMYQTHRGRGTREVKNEDMSFIFTISWSSAFMVSFTAAKW